MPYRPPPPSLRVGFYVTPDEAADPEALRPRLQDRAAEHGYVVPDSATITVYPPIVADEDPTMDGQVGVEVEAVLA